MDPSYSVWLPRLSRSYNTTPFRLRKLLPLMGRRDTGDEQNQRSRISVEPRTPLLQSISCLPFDRVWIRPLRHHGIHRFVHWPPVGQKPHELSVQLFGLQGHQCDRCFIQGCVINLVRAVRSQEVGYAEGTWLRGIVYDAGMPSFKHHQKLNQKLRHSRESVEMQIAAPDEAPKYLDRGYARGRNTSYISIHAGGRIWRGKEVLA